MLPDSWRLSKMPPAVKVCKMPRHSFLQFLRSAVDFFLFSNLFVALAVTGLTCETFFLINLHDYKYPVFIFFSTLFLYNFHRVFRMEYRSEKEQKENRHYWVKGHAVYFYLILIIAFTGVVYSLIFFLNIRTIFFLIPVGIISFGYSIPFIRTSKGLIRLRDVPGLKIFLISFVLSCVTVLLPVTCYNGNVKLMDPALGFIFVRRMLFVFAITIPFDIRDMEYDGENNAKTIPLIFGIEKSKKIALAALMVFILLALAQYLSIKNTNAFYIFALIVSSILTSVIILQTNRDRKEYFYSFLVEGTMLMQCLLVFLANKF